MNFWKRGTFFVPSQIPWCLLDGIWLLVLIRRKGFDKSILLLSESFRATTSSDTDLIINSCSASYLTFLHFFLRIIWIEIKTEIRSKKPKERGGTRFGIWINSTFYFWRNGSCKLSWKVIKWRLKLHLWGLLLYCFTFLQKSPILYFSCSASAKSSSCEKPQIRPTFFPSQIVEQGKKKWNQNSKYFNFLKEIFLVCPKTAEKSTKWLIWIAGCISKRRQSGYPQITWISSWILMEKREEKQM